MLNSKKKNREAVACKQSMLPSTGSDLAASCWVEIRLSSKGTDKTIHLCSVNAVLRYTAEEIALRLGKETVIFLGKNMVFSSYRNGSASITGKLDSISFLGGNR